MLRTLRINRSIYLMDDEEKSYRILRRNPYWRKLTARQNQLNKRQLVGYTRIFTNDKTRRINYE